MKLHICKICERSYLSFGPADMGSSEDGGLVLHVPREAPAVAGLGICPDCEFEMEQEEQEQGSEWADDLDLENINALLPGSVVDLDEGRVLITDSLAEGPAITTQPMIGYEGIVIEPVHEKWQEEDVVWFMPEHIVNVVLVAD